MIVTHSSPGGQCELGRRSFTVGTQTVTVVAHTMSGGPIVSATCVTPPAKFNFLTTDAFAYQWTGFSGIRAGDVVRRDFISPNGSLFFTSSDVFPARSDNCAWDSIPIAGNTAASLLGNWQARVYYNNVLILTENFTITQAGSNSPFTPGDVFVAVTNGQVQWRRADGTLVQILNTGEASIMTGMAFDKNANLYVTSFETNKVHRFSSTGLPLGTFGSGFNCNPESIVFDRDGNVYVGQAGPDSPTSTCSRSVLKFDAAGNRLATFTPDREGRGTDWIELAEDQCTLFYTSEGKRIKRFDVCENRQLPDFVTGLPGSDAYALRLLPSGGLIVADTQRIVRLDAAGNVVREYDAPGEDLWFAVNLDPDGASFWSAGITTGNVYKFDLATGNQLLSFNSGAPPTSGGSIIGGLAVFGEIISGQADLKITKDASPNPVRNGSNLTYTMTITNNGSAAANSVTVTDNLPAGTTFVSCNATGGGVCGGTGNNRTITFNSLASGASATIALVANVNSLCGSQITNTATVRSATTPVSNSTTVTTTVQCADPRTVRLACPGSANRGSLLIFPVELVSQGDENAFGFSLNFDTTVLSNPQVATGADAANASLNINSSQVAQGRLGVALSLSSGQTFAAGVRQIAIITFNVSANTTATGASVVFGDAPISRQVSNANAQVLATIYQGCQNIPIGDPAGYEADVTPRPNGKNDGTISITDWVQVGRFAAGLDTAAVGGEFQRADCAPRDTRGDGALAIIDWVQAGRYAAGLDAPQRAGGPTAPTAFAPDVNNATSKTEAAHARALRVVNANFQRGQINTLEIEIEAEGDENALGFSLNFDPSVLAFISAEAGSGVSGAQLNYNSNQAANGRLGIALALPAGQRMKAGKQTVVIVRFNALASSNAAATTINFGDQPIRRQISDVNANLTAASYTDGSVTFGNPVTSVSAASFKQEIAAESIVAAFGVSLATATAGATTQPLPTSLAGTTVKVRDNAGAERLAPLFFVTPNQVNYQAPPGAASGAATITITSGNGVVSAGTINITPVAPSLFAANSDGQGVGATVAIRVKPDGSQVFESTSRFDPALNRFVHAPIDLGPPNDLVVLVIFGTGFRNRSSLSAVSVNIGGVNAPVDYAGPQPGFAGLDQLNVRLPRSLAGRGEVDIVVTVDGKTANIIKVFIK